MIFNPSDGIEKAYQQQSYWEGGNKNELILCFGLNSDRTVNWCYFFSWEDDRKMAINMMNLYRNNEQLDMVNLSNQIIDNLKNWKRKEFSDFKYIKVELTKTQYIVWFILTILVNVVLALYVVNNDYDNE